ncbi:MAG TPA: choice-of-anchor tandem repeat GloVer-containing protein [Terriglobales bacterium]
MYSLSVDATNRKRAIGEPDKKACGCMGSSLPPLRKAQGRGTHCHEPGRQSKGWATRPMQIPAPGRATRILAIALGLFLAAQADAQYKILHNFTGGADGDGGQAMALDPVGNIYGASIGGGSQNGGLVYELTRGPNGDWTFSALYNFTGKSDGAGPNSPLILNSLGNIYGTTQSGGGPHGGGTAFELSPGKNGWTQKTLFSFCPAMEKDICLDAGGTVSSPVPDENGNFYGTKPWYGGVIYELTKVSGIWTETLLRKFCPNGSGQCADGVAPYAAPILSTTGSLYGTTFGGGNQCGSSTCGTVYELSPQGDGHWQESVLFRFNGQNGQFPGSGALYMDETGVLYGTTELGGTYGGIAFRLTPQGGGHWRYAIIHNFLGGPSGSLPYWGVVMDKIGNLYGTTDGGGNLSGCGVIYKLAPAPGDKWKYSVLHTFGNGFDGCVPEGNLAIDQNGNLYGGTVLGGEYGYGIVFQLSTVPVSDQPSR